MIIPVLYSPNCHDTAIVRHGKTHKGKQRDRCRAPCCAGRTFLLKYAYAGRTSEVKPQSVALAMQASGMGDTTARVVPISLRTVMAA
jgi:transposase-like protein